MTRTLMQIYTKDSGEAVALYQRAFNAKLVVGQPNQERYDHAELDIYGQIIAVSERKSKAGNNMQFCLQFGLDEKEKVVKAFEVLKEGAKKVYPPDSCEWSPMFLGLWISTA